MKCISKFLILIGLLTCCLFWITGCGDSTDAPPKMAINKIVPWDVVSLKEIEKIMAIPVKKMISANEVVHREGKLYKINTDNLVTGIVHEPNEYFSNRITFKKGIPDGLRVEYRSENNQVILGERYKKGLLVTESYFARTNGKLLGNHNHRVKGNFKTSTHYFVEDPDNAIGTIALSHYEQRDIITDTLDGHAAGYYRNGKPKWHRIYKEGKIASETKYDESGNQIN